MSKREYRRILNEALDEIFGEAADLGFDIHELVTRSGLCLKTVVRIRDRHTELPYYRTVIALARAVGMRVILMALRVHAKAG